MKTYKAISKGFKEFNLLDENEQFLGKIYYPKWYSYEIKIETAQGIFDVEMKGFWKTNMEQFDANHSKIRTALITWKGFILEENSGKKYYLSSKGFWDYHFVLEDENKNELLNVHSKFSWKEFNSIYEISTTQDFDTDFLLLIIHCVNYRMVLSTSGIN